MNERQPDHLRIKDRKKLSPEDFADDDRLLRRYILDDMDDRDEIDINSIRFPNVSCNWSRFSFPADVQFLPYARVSDGCYSFTVVTARFCDIATPVHDPVSEPDYENYAHVEIRELLDEEDVFTEPPQGRKKKRKEKARRAEWRRHIVQNLTIETEATA